MGVGNALWWTASLMPSGRQALWFALLRVPGGCLFFAGLWTLHAASRTR
jgi:hypothetical protein